MLHGVGPSGSAPASAARAIPLRPVAGTGVARALAPDLTCHAPSSRAARISGLPYFRREGLC